MNILRMTIRNIQIQIIVVMLLLAFSSGIVTADELSEHNPAGYQHSGEKYPPVLLVTNIKEPSMSQMLSNYNAFARIDEEALGLPIGIRALKLLRTKNDGTRFSTVMLAATTLGLSPIVSNEEFTVRYDLFVQGSIVSTFEYHMDSTDVSNLWSGPRKDSEIKPKEQVFIEDTVNRFLNELKNSPDAQAVFTEYHYYFGKDS